MIIEAHIPDPEALTPELFTDLCLTGCPFRYGEGDINDEGIYMFLSIEAWDPTIDSNEVNSVCKMTEVLNKDGYYPAIGLETGTIAVFHNGDEIAPVVNAKVIFDYA